MGVAGEAHFALPTDCIVVGWIEVTPMPNPGANDIFFRLAIDLVITHRRATTRLLQERLGIGYHTALLLLSRLEGEGVIGPPDCNGVREVLIGQ